MERIRDLLPDTLEQGNAVIPNSTTENCVTENCVTENSLLDRADSLDQVSDSYDIAGQSLNSVGGFLPDSVWIKDANQLEILSTR